MLERHLKKGLRVLVTAGAAGIGREIVRALVEDGARVHICDVDTAALDDARREHAVTTSVTDVAEVEQVERLFVDVSNHLGGLDVLVNNAGIAGPTARVEAITPVDWRRTIAVNLDGQFYCTHLAVPLLRESRRGVIVNMATSRRACALSRARLNCVAKPVRSSALALRANAPEQKRDEDLWPSSTTGRLCLLGSRRVHDRGELKRSTALFGCSCCSHECSHDLVSLAIR